MDKLPGKRPQICNKRVTLKEKERKIERERQRATNNKIEIDTYLFVKQTGKLSLVVLDNERQQKSGTKIISEKASAKSIDFKRFANANQNTHTHTNLYLNAFLVLMLNRY